MFTGFCVPRLTIAWSHPSYSHTHRVAWEIVVCLFLMCGVVSLMRADMHYCIDLCDWMLQWMHPNDHLSSQFTFSLNTLAQCCIIGCIHHVCRLMLYYVCTFFILCVAPANRHVCAYHCVKHYLPANTFKAPVRVPWLCSKCYPHLVHSGCQ